MFIELFNFVLQVFGQFFDFFRKVELMKGFSLFDFMLATLLFSIIIRILVSIYDSKVGDD